MGIAKVLPLLALFSLFVLDTLVGSSTIGFWDIFNLEGDMFELFWELRVPRALGALFCGATLALCGLMYQIVFRNTLAEPYILGVSGGATLGVALAIKLNIVILSTISIYFFSFGGALFGIFLLMLFSFRLSNSFSVGILLIGVALGILFSSLIFALAYFGDYQKSLLVLRLNLGNLGSVEFFEMCILFVSFIVILVLLLFYKNELALLSISQEQAIISGLAFKKTLLILLLVSSFSLSLQVGVVGSIGFVGLIVPNIAKILYKKSAYSLYGESALLGAIFLLFCDVLSKSVSPESEVPIGIICAIIGAPTLIFILLKR